MTSKTDEQQRAAFMGWLTTHCDYDDLNKSEVALALDAWQAAIALDRQGRGEPVAWRWRIPIVANNGDVLEYSDWVLGNKPNFLSWWPHEELMPPQPAAPAVKDDEYAKA